jgi:putative NADPH-quinone reductase
MGDSRRVLIIQDSSEDHLCHGLTESYAKCARSAGFEVREVTVAALDYPVLRSKCDFDRQQLPASLNAARDAIVASDHIVLVFPLGAACPRF